MAEEEEDQNSGWLEVKKKHRANSKLRTLSNPDGSVNKRHTLTPLSQSSQIYEAKNMQSICQVEAAKEAANIASHSNTSSADNPEVNKEVLIKKNIDAVRNIKWGDLDDVETYTISTSNANSKDKVENEDDAISWKPVSNGSSFDDEELVLEKLSIAVHNESSDDTLKEISKVPHEGLELKLVSSNDTVSIKQPDDTDDTKISDMTECKASHAIINNRSKDENHNVSGILESVESVTNTNVMPQVNKAARCLIDASVTNTGDISAEGGEFGDGNSEECKERFRERLWCFLFENLNRAVDELYLLCELECDKEQMNEAILVLEEAGSDFKELKGRMEHFENTKRGMPQSPKDGIPANVKTDHRRPHALSWEVRRMTTSSHRADILSSSLEAFQKIQLERASRHAARDTKVVNSSLANTQSNSGILVRASSKRREQNTNQEKQQRATISNQGNTITERPDGKDKVSVGNTPDKQLHAIVGGKRNSSSSDNEKEREKRSTATWKPMDAWKEQRNWEDILRSPMRSSTRASYAPGVARKGTERTRVLHDKLMSPEKKRKTALDLKKDAEEKHARAMRIRRQLENERIQRLQRTSDKLNRVNEWQAVRSLKLREGMHARHQRSESRHEAYLAQVVRRAGDESSKVNEVRFITSLNEENKKLILRQKLHDSEARRTEKLQVIKSKQKEDMAREEAVLGRRKLLEAEKLQRLAEIQRKKEEAQLRREEERRASSAAREAKTLEQLRKKEASARVQQEEAELLAQRLAERLRESEQRRKSYLEQIREKASMDFRDQSSVLMRRSFMKDGQNRSISANSVEDCTTSCISNAEESAKLVSTTQQQSLKRRTKKIRQRLMALKYEFNEPLVGTEHLGIGYRALVGTARAKVGRWLQELQRLRQARKEGAANIGLIVGEMVKFLDGKDPELHAARQAGLLDFISSALPASHTSKPEAYQVTMYLLRLLRIVLSMPQNRSYFLAQNLLPPMIPMLAASLENYIKIAASSSAGTSNIITSKTTENLDAIAEVLGGFLWTVTMILGHACSDDRQFQMQDGLLELIVSYQIIHRLRDLFALYDRPQIEGSPFPNSILLSLNFLAVLTSRQRTMFSIDWEACMSLATPENKVQQSTTQDDYLLDESNSLNREESTETVNCAETTITEVLHDGNKNSNGVCIEIKTIDEQLSLNKPVAFLLSAIAETGLVGLPSLLTAVLLQANNRLSSEQASYVLPSNFEEVATGVLKVLNNLALLDIVLLQRMLAKPDLKMELFHLMSFLLSYCTSKWKSTNDKNGLLLFESLLLLGCFALFCPGNQAVLHWGKSPTILHKVCDLPFVFFSDPELSPILASTLVAACYGSEQNRGLVLQELSVDMLLSLIKSCKKQSLPSQSNTPLHDSIQGGRKNQDEYSLKSSKKGIKIALGKGKANKGKTQRENRGLNKSCDECALKSNPNFMENSSTLMLHERFPSTFLDKAGEFFSSGSVNVQT